MSRGTIESHRIKIQLKWVQIILIFEAFEMNSGRIMYSVEAHNINERGGPDGIYFNDTYNKVYDTEKQYRDAMKRYQKKEVKKLNINIGE